jgi:hypothetical protein
VIQEYYAKLAAQQNIGGDGDGDGEDDGLDFVEVTAPSSLLKTEVDSQPQDIRAR